MIEFDVSIISKEAVEEAKQEPRVKWKQASITYSDESAPLFGNNNRLN